MDPVMEDMEVFGVTVEGERAADGGLWPTLKNAAKMRRMCQ